MAVSAHELEDEISKTMAALGGRELVEGANRTWQVEVSERSFKVTWSPAANKKPASVLVGTVLESRDPPPLHREASGAGYRAVDAFVDPQPIVLRRESAIDRFGKRLGINREVQTGDRAFDDAVYVESDVPHERLGEILRSGALRPAVEAILGHAPFARVGLFEDDGRALRVSFVPDGLRPLQRDALAALLDASARVAESLPPVAQSGRPRPRNLRNVATIAILCSIIAGILFGVIASASTRHVTNGATATGVLVGMGLWLLAVPLLVLFYRGRSTSLRDVIVTTFALGLTLPFTAVGAIATANAAGIEAPPQRHEVEVLKKWKTSGKNTTYSVLVSSYRPGKSKLSISLRRVEYERLPSSGRVVLTTREGRLGWDLLDSIEPQP